MFRFVQVMLCVHCEPRKAGVKFFVCATYLANKDDSDSDSDSDYVSMNECKLELNECWMNFWWDCSFAQE